MPPMLATENSSDGTPRHMVFAGQCIVRSSAILVTPANFLYLDLGQFRVLVLLAQHRVSATFPVHIKHIVLLRAKKQVLGVDAMRHIAAMAHIQPVGDWPIGGLIHQTMGKLAMAFSIGVLTIALACAPALPQPASAGINNNTGQQTSPQRHIRRRKSPLWRCSAAFAAAKVQALLSPMLVVQGIEGFTRQFTLAFMAARGRINARHLSLLDRLGVVTPGGVTSTAPAFCCPNYTIGRG